MKNDIKVQVGDLGEQFIQQHFNSKRADWFNSKRDGHVGIMSYEGKTIRLNYKTQGFWLGASQFAKLDGVDLFFIIKIPESLEELAKLYLCVDHKNCYETAPLGRKGIRSYPLSKCLWIADVNEETSASMYYGSISLSKHGRYGTSKSA